MELGGEESSKQSPMEQVLVGGVHDAEGSQNSTEFEELARFAIEDHNKKANAPPLEFVRVVKVKEGVVAGMMYYIALEAKDQTGEKKLYEARIWVKLWMNFKQVQEFKQIQSVDELAATD